MEGKSSSASQGSHSERTISPTMLHISGGRAKFWGDSALAAVSVISMVVDENSCGGCSLAKKRS
jgi:hypothetical protein